MKPILFNTEMVKAILEGQKTATRRVVKEKGWDITGQPKWANGEFWFNVCVENKEKNAKISTCHFLKPPYCTGEILYVRETWRKVCAVEKLWLNGENFTCDEHFGYQYKADGEIKYDDCFDEVNDEFNSFDYTFDNRWKPSIHMPRQIARIFLRVTNVRVERLQDIDCEGARQEGCDGRCDVPSNGAEGVLSCVTKDFSVEKFQDVWDSTIKHSDFCKYGWNANPYVWVIEFERCDKPEV